MTMGANIPIFHIYRNTFQTTIVCTVVRTKCVVSNSNPLWNTSVVMTLPNNTVVLQGQDGETIKMNIERVAKCHALNLDYSVHKREDVLKSHICEICRLPDDRKTMVLCDICVSGWHLDCLEKYPHTYSQVNRRKVHTEDYACQYCLNIGRIPKPVSAHQYCNIDIKERLESYAPGKWTKTHVSKLKNNLANSVHKPLEFLATIEEEWNALLRTIKIPCNHYIWDPFAGNSDILRELLPETNQLHANDLNSGMVVDTYINAVEEGYYDNFILQNGIAGILMTSMPFSLVDVVVPMLVVKLPNIVLCFHVGPNALSDAPIPRHEFWQKLAHIRNIHIIHGIKRNSTGHRGQWVIIKPSNKNWDEVLQIDNNKIGYFSTSMEY